MSELTAQQRRGKWITSAVAVAFAGLNIVPLLPPKMSGLILKSVWWPNELLVVGFALSLFQGVRWVRAFLALVWVLLGSYWMLSPVLTHRPFGVILVVSSLGALQIGEALVLWYSPSVEAYFDRQSPPRDRPLSMKDLDGV
jgi:hypothetical protein